jgi:hypothetical protein
MSKELKNITENVMDKIHHDKIKIRPKAYFIFGSFLAFLGLVFSMMISVFLVGLIRFSLRAHGPMASYRFDQIVASFPWWMAVVAVSGLIFGIWLLRHYDFSYKVNFKLVVIGFVVAIIIAGLVIDMTGLNDRVFKRGPGRGMRQYLNSDKPHLQYGQGLGQWKNNLN